MTEDSEGKKLEKKKLHKKRKRTRDGESNGGDDSVVTEDRQGKKRKLEKVLSKKNSGTGDEDDDQGKKMEKKKKKKKDKLSEESKHDEFKSNGGEDDDQDKEKKKKKKKKKKNKKLIEESTSEEEYNKFRSNEDGDQGKMMMKKKKKKKKLSDNSNEGDPSLASVEAGDAKACGVVTEADDQSKKKKTKKKAKAGTGESTNPAARGRKSKPKRVTFSDQVEVCTDTLVRGKRFTPEEDAKIREAVSDYIESHGLGDEGIDWILNSRSHPQVKGCWMEIGAALPHRPIRSVNSRAHILFERDVVRKWTPEEIEFLRKFYDQHGADWKSAAVALGKHRIHVKDTWRRIKHINANRGRWNQDEYQKLFDLVNKDLRIRATEECRKSQHGMLRDNVSWEAISNKFGARASQQCCQKWYQQLTSPMVADGVWRDTDDYRLLNALYALDACNMEEVDWDDLLEHRSGDLCRKRWSQMVRYIGEHGKKSFAEQVEILSKRFCPDLVEAREAFDSKPVVG